jgi:opacity protein-like surface antigen
MLRKLLTSCLLSLPLAANAAGISYNYVELNYIVDQKLDFGGGVDDDGDGWNFNGSFALNDTFFVNGGYSDVTLDDTDVDLSNLNLGIGARSALSDKVDMFGVLSYEDYEVDIPGFGSFDEDGFGVAGGLRGLISDGLELNGQVKYTDVGDADGWGFKIGGVFAFAPNWAINASYSASELEESGTDLDIDELRLGLRYTF